ncbi:hypothetical protein JF544_13640 [Halobacillus kuroshimensis]|uniref:YtxH domain-containing protein n=1 Tax=Halobacillus kuroshimensis TaxID=302481 RepID=A0ABS3DYM4_9BACI|nr:hypothetical protein [Halobacillus kuroshimensis]MBN8236304.1 hypothetical protein [Halobacillus kuroshimensis]
MKTLEWVSGLTAGALTGILINSLTRDPSIAKMKMERKKGEFYQTGKIQYEDIQTARETMRNEAQKNIRIER